MMDSPVHLVLMDVQAAQELQDSLDHLDSQEHLVRIILDNLEPRAALGLLEYLEIPDNLASLDLLDSLEPQVIVETLEDAEQAVNQDLMVVQVVKVLRAKVVYPDLMDAASLVELEGPENLAGQEQEGLMADQAAMDSLGSWVTMDRMVWMVLGDLKDSLASLVSLVGMAYLEILV